MLRVEAIAEVEKVLRIGARVCRISAAGIATVDPIVIAVDDVVANGM